MVTLDKHHATLLRAIEWLENYTESGSAFESMDDIDQQDCFNTLESLRDMHEELYGERWES